MLRSSGPEACFKEQGVQMLVGGEVIINIFNGQHGKINKYKSVSITT